MYYIFTSKILDKGYFAEHMEVLENGKVFDQSVCDVLYSGVPIKNRNLEITFPKSRGKLSNVLNGLFDFVVVSNLILDTLLKNCSSYEFEYFPVKIDRKTNLTYYCVNILNSIDAFDFDKSEWESYIEETPILKSISKLVLKEHVVKDRHIFRVTKGCRLNIFISAQLKKELELLNMPELVFTPIDKYSLGIGKTDWEDIFS